MIGMFVGLGFSFAIFQLVKAPAIFESTAIVRVPLQPDTENPSGVAMEFLTSNWVLDSVTGESSHDPVLQWLDLADPLENLRRRLSVTEIPDQHELYEIRCVGESPESAHGMLSQVLKSLCTLREEHMRIQQSVVDLVVSETPTFEQYLAKLERQAAQFPSGGVEGGQVDPEESFQSVLAKLDGIRRTAEETRDYFAGIEVVQWPTQGTPVRDDLSP